MPLGKHEISETLIIIPTLGKRKEYLIECLDSLTNQTSPPHVVVGYPLRVAKEMSQFKERFPIIDFVTVEGTQVEVINKIANNYSHYKYMNWLGDDDRLPLNSIELSELALKTDSNIRGTFGIVRYIDSVGNVVGTYTPPKIAQKLICIIPAAIKLEAGLFYTSDFIKIGGINTQLKFAPCVYTTIQLRKFGRWERIKAVLCDFRIHPDSETAANRMAGLREATRTQMLEASQIEKFLNFSLRYPFRIFKIVIFQLIAGRSQLKKIYTNKSLSLKK